MQSSRASRITDWPHRLHQQPPPRPLNGLQPHAAEVAEPALALSFDRHAETDTLEPSVRAADTAYDVPPPVVPPA